MWPWEHLALGYLIGSVGLHLGGAGPPTTTATVVIAIGTQLPDIIDKPLAWAVGVLPSGLSLGHSILFAVPLWAVVLVLGHRRNQRVLAMAFVLAHASHFLGDVLYVLLADGRLAVGFLFWPLVPTTTETGAGLLARVAELALSFVGFLATPRGLLYLLFEGLLLGSALYLWHRDSRPAAPL